MSSEFTLAKIGERLELIRLARGHIKRGEQKKWAQSFGFGETTYAMWENGQQRIPTDEAVKIVAKTGATLDYIYLGVESTLPKSLSAAIDEAKNLPRKRRAKAG